MLVPENKITAKEVIFNADPIRGVKAPTYKTNKIDNQRHATVTNK